MGQKDGFRGSGRRIERGGCKEAWKQGGRERVGRRANCGEFQISQH